jgi:hypothetical protein
MGSACGDFLRHSSALLSFSAQKKQVAQILFDFLVMRVMLMVILSVIFKGYNNYRR